MAACFILPAALITGVIAWIYVQYHDLPRVAAMLRGISPAVLAIILCAVWKLGKAAIKLATGHGWPRRGCRRAVRLRSTPSLLVGTLLGGATLGARRKTSHPGKTTLGLLGAMLAKRRRRRP